MRVCLIGNSHLAAIKLGWDIVRERYPGIQVRCFGAPANTLQHLSSRNGRVVGTQRFVRQAFAMTSGGRKGIFPPLYDAFVVVGAGFGALAAVKLANSHTPHGLGIVRGRFLVSDDFFDAALTAILRRSLACRTVALLRPLTDAPVAILPQPMPSLEITKRFRMWAGYEEVRLAEMIAARFERAAASAAESVGAYIIGQPGETVVNQLFTPDRYARNSIRLLKAVRHPDSDCFHMNADYGVRAIEEVLARLAPRSPADRPSPPCPNAHAALSHFS